MHRLAALTLALLAPLLLALPAHAEESAPVLAFPIHSSATEVVVQINAGPRSWGIRKAARTMDSLVDGLTFRTSGDCATADVCVEVRAGSYSAEEMLTLTNGAVPSWAGLVVYPTARDRIVFLNTRVVRRGPNRARVAAHELGHVLGLAHHDSPGLMAISHSLEQNWLSDTELALLRAWYGNPSARA